MCGRFAITQDPTVFQLELQLGQVPQELGLDPNIAPGRLVPVVVDGVTREVKMFKWGLVPFWARDPLIGNKLINARAETIAEKPSFRNAFARRRCLILADCFYEWKTEGNKRVSYRFALVGGKPFTFAGIWEDWRDRSGSLITTCAIITTVPNDLLQEYHDRMPVILDATSRWKWLEAGASTLHLLEMLKPYPAELMAVPEKVDPKFLYLLRE